MFFCSITGIVLFLLTFLLFLNYCFINKKEDLKIYFGFSSIVMFFLCCFFFIATYSSITYNEIRNYYITKISHQERYSKKVVYYVSVYAGRDSKGNPKYRRERRTRTDYFGPYFTAYSNSGVEYPLTENEYNKWKKLWGEKYIKTIKGTSTLFTKSIDGKYFESTWNGVFEHIYPKPERHKYQNVLRNSNSVFGFNYGDGIIHPVDKGNMNGIISEISLSESEIAEFANFNAYNGGLHQIHVITLITKNKANNSLETINKWGGLNKNELAVFIGIDNDKNIIWTDAHSWMDNTKCQNLIRDNIICLKKFDATKIRKIYEDNLKFWKRKEFKDFNYIEIQLPASAKFVFGLIIATFVGLVTYAVIKNKKRLIDID